jgi:hypothetical protein
MTTPVPAPIPRMPRRYRVARLLHLAGLLYLSLAGWSRMILALTDYDLLQELQVVPGPTYLVVGGALWGLLGVAASVLLFVPRRWARWGVLTADLLFALSYWLDRIFFVRASQAQANWPFALFLTLALLAFSGSVLFLLDQWEVSHGGSQR